LSGCRCQAGGGSFVTSLHQIATSLRTALDVASSRPPYMADPKIEAAARAGSFSIPEKSGPFRPGFPPEPACRSVVMCPQGSHFLRCPAGRYQSHVSAGIAIRGAPRSLRCHLGIPVFLRSPAERYQSHVTAGIANQGDPSPSSPGRASQSLLSCGTEERRVSPGSQSTGRPSLCFSV